MPIITKNNSTLTIQEVEQLLRINIDQLPRVIAVFDKKVEWLAKEIKLNPIPLAILQDLFNLPAEDPMITDYEITPAQMKILKLYFIDKTKAINFKEYNYFLSID